MANEDVLITIAGDSAPLVAAAADASAAFSDMAVAAGSASSDIAAAMADLSASMVELQASIDMLAASMDTLAGSSAAAGASVEEAGAASAAATTETATLGETVAGVSGAFDALTGSVMPLLTAFGSLLAIMGAMVIINDVSSWIENLVQQMFDLDKQTQRVVNSWQYLFALAPGGGQKAAQGLAAWAYAESPKLPFTAVDLRSAISTIGTIPDMTPGQIEQFMPVLADIASTLGASDYGGQGINLQQAAQAIVGARFGLTRQLRYELHINPDELLAYGLKGTATRTGLRITDPTTLIPSIMKWAAHRGLVGAATEQETSTFWGAWSSFQDYLQNFLQTAGGISPQTGGVTPGSMFGELQKILIGVNSLLGGPEGTAGATVVGVGPVAGHPGAHGSQMAALKRQADDLLPSLLDVSHVLNDIFGGVVTSGESLFQGLFGGLAAAGAGQMLLGLFNTLKDFGNWLNSAPIQKDIRGIGAAIGEFFGANLQSAKSALPDLAHALENLGKAAIGFWNSFSPAQHNQLKEFGGLLVEVAAGIASFLAALVTALTAIHGFATALGDWAGNLGKQFRQWGSDFIHQLIQGIQSALPSLGSMMSSVAGTIASRVHFSKPDEGPLADADRWMPDMMMMFEQGIMRGLPGVARASSAAAATIGLIGAMGHPAFAAVGGGLSNSYATNYNTSYGGSSGTLNMYGVSNQQLEMAVERVLAAHDQRGFLNFAQPGGFSLFGVH